MYDFRSHFVLKTYMYVYVLFSSYKMGVHVIDCTVM